MKTKNKFLIFVDVESTGFAYNGGSMKNDLLTWSALITDEKLNIVDKTTIKSKPTSKENWSYEAEEIHKITYHEALRFDKPELACEKILDFLTPYAHTHNWPLMWIEHSLNWIDFKFTRGIFYRYGDQFKLNRFISEKYRKSTIHLARELQYRENKLDNWAKRINFELDHHNSESDAMACYEVYKFLINQKNKPESIGSLELCF